MQAADVLTTIAESLVATQKYKSLDEALYALAIGEVDRKIAKYRRRINHSNKVTVQPSVIASGFCEAIPTVVGSNHCETISESVFGDCFGTKNRASQ